MDDDAAACLYQRRTADVQEYLPPYPTSSECLTEVPGKAPFEAAYLQQSSAFRALHGLRYAQDILRAGFTTLREVGNEANYACADVRKAINARQAIGAPSEKNVAAQLKRWSETLNH